MILNDHPPSYIQELQDDLQAMVRTSGLQGLQGQAWRSLYQTRRCHARRRSDSRCTPWRGGHIVTERVVAVKNK